MKKKKQKPKKPPAKLSKEIPGQATLFPALPDKPPPKPRTRWKHEHGLARASDPSTAQEAAHTVRTAEIKMKILAAIARYSAGLISHEIADETGVHLVSVSPRLRPLEKEGLIHDSGLTRSGASGKESIVWKIGKAPKTTAAEVREQQYAERHGLVGLS